MRFKPPPGPWRPNPANPDPTDYERVAGNLISTAHVVACPKCGAVVKKDRTARHDWWHAHSDGYGIHLDRSEGGSEDAHNGGHGPGADGEPTGT